MMKTNNSIAYSKLKYFIAFISTILCLNISLNAEQPQKPFVVFDSIHYPDKGDLTKYGLKNYTIFYHVHIWSKETRQKERMPSMPPSDKRLAGLVKDISPAKSPVIFDIEHWPLDIRKGIKSAADDDIATANAKEVTDSMNKMIHIVNYSKKVNPTVKYGYYGCIPLRDYWAPVQDSPEKIEAWKKANDYLKPLADSVDVICPSLYAFYPDREAWVKYAKANIEEAKRLANGKPVYAYLWPKYHNSNKENGKTFIEGDFWKLQLETVYNSGVDGVIIWDSHQVTGNNPGDKKWDSQRPWWKETVSFLERINNKDK